MAYTNLTRITGINTGWDTEKLIGDLMKAESLRLTRLQKNAALITMRQDLYRGMYDDLKNFQKSFLDILTPGSMRSQSTFSGLKTSVKNSAGQDSSAIKVGAGAKTGTYTLQIAQLAVADLYESAAKIGGDISSRAGFEFKAANIKAGTSFEISLDGVSKKISFNEGDTVEGGKLTFEGGSIGVKKADGTVTTLDEQGFIEVFNQKLKNAFGSEGTGSQQKIEARLTANGGVSIFTNGYHSGFSIADGAYAFSTASAANKSALASGNATSARQLGLNLKIGGASTTINVDITEGMSQKEMVASLNQALEDQGLDNKAFFHVDAASGKITLTNFSSSETVRLSDQNDASGSLAYLGYDGPVELSPGGSLNTLGIASGSVGAFNTSRTLSEVFGGSLTRETSFTINGRTFTFSGNTKISDLINTVNKADIGVTLRYDEFSQKMQLEANKTGYANSISLSGALLTDNFGFGATAKRAAADSVATINGTTLTRPDNQYEFLGVNWTLNKATGDDELTVTISQDTDSIVDKIKSFVDGYNELVKKLKGLTNTPRPRYNGDYYDPLLDEEKAEMKDKEIELWEKNANTGLLFRDSILTRITNDLRTALNGSVTLEDGTKISLYSLGISTSKDMSKSGQLEIDEDKLRAAIETYGDKVTDLFTKTSAEGGKGLAERVNDIVEAAVSKNGSIARKAGIEGTESEFNNELYRQLTARNDSISAMLTKLANKENYYYNMFARMEAAMSQSSSQMSYITSMLGSS